MMNEIDMSGREIGIKIEVIVAVRGVIEAAVAEDIGDEEEVVEVEVDIDTDPIVILIGTTGLSFKAGSFLYRYNSWNLEDL
jgi:hypothetical protein